MKAAISKFTIQNGMEKEVNAAFKNRPKLVEGARGFLKMDVLSPLSNPAEIHLSGRSIKDIYLHIFR